MSITATAVKFHVGLHVADRQRAVNFYRVLFGVSPVRDVDDHVRFEPGDPPLVVVLVPSPQEPGGALNHLGLRVGDATELVTIQRRLEEAGITTQRQDGVECCYARQTKFWVADPDRNLWEIYTVEEDLAYSGFVDPPPVAASAETEALWEHRLTEPLPERIDRADESVTEVRLEGSFNADVSPERLGRFLVEVRRILRPGGRLAVHGLVGDRPFPGTPALPGLASLVRRIPSWEEMAATVGGSGFGSLFFEKLGDIHCFRVNGVELREARLLAWRLAAAANGTTRYVLYKGPFEQVSDDEGNVYLRGQRVAIRTAVRDLLRDSVLAGQFLFYPDEQTE
jgi:catechol 2,3-dioxygenase-like lactoylglutathione lyase family enzyme